MAEARRRSSTSRQVRALEVRLEEAKAKVDRLDLQKKIAELRERVRSRRTGR